MARVAPPILLALFLLSALTRSSLASGDAAVRIDLWADRDDDDADGRPDGDESVLPAAARLDLAPIDGRLAGRPLEVLSGSEHARALDADGRPLSWSPPPTTAAFLEGLSPGRVEVAAAGRGSRTRLTLAVSGIAMRDGEGHLVDMARSHASLERVPPERVAPGTSAPYADPDALRVELTRPDDGPGLDGDRELTVESVDSAGARIDELRALTLLPARCVPASSDTRCWVSAPLRLVIDDVDRNHPLGAGRSIKAIVGGAVVFRLDGRKAQMIRVLGPRATAAGPIARLRATLRPFVVRVSPGGAPAVGTTDGGAVETVRSELGAASAAWGQCGVTFGDPRQLEVRVVDPPTPYLVAIGDDLGLRASGGQIRLRADGRLLSVATKAAEPPLAVAFDLAHAAERAGLSAVVSPNAPIEPAAGASVDVLLRRRDGALAVADAIPTVPLSTDPTLSVRVGSVDLSDGLEHFTDTDAMAGTLEERTLVKAFDDGNPATIEVFVVPLFAGGGRIGESFIGTDLSSMRNVVLLDRAGIRARKSSLTLAHELGHVLMDLPGHPDDYGTDTPTLLMDSDAADASPFGPRRIPLEECVRVVREAGPGARTPLLTEWPIGPVPIPATRRPR